MSSSTGSRGRTSSSSIGTDCTASTAGAARRSMMYAGQTGTWTGRERWDESMIARHDAHTEKADIWSRLAEPLPNGVVYWRQDGKVIARDGKYFARFVAYIEANTARERLDAVVPGEWDLTLELLPPLPGIDDSADGGSCSFKARLQILGVIREDVGTGRDHRRVQASRCSLRHCARALRVRTELGPDGRRRPQREAARGSRRRLRAA